MKLCEPGSWGFHRRSSWKSRSSRGGADFRQINTNEVQKEKYQRSTQMNLAGILLQADMCVQDLPRVDGVMW